MHPASGDIGSPVFQDNSSRRRRRVRRRPLRRLGHHITTRARSNAVFHHPTRAASGNRGRPRLRGNRIGAPTDIAADASNDTTWGDTLITRYDATVTARTERFDAAVDPVQEHLGRMVGCGEVRDVVHRIGHTRVRVEFAGTETARPSTVSSFDHTVIPGHRMMLRGRGAC
jgi:hypothetical protein